jgi:hypothetical protein
VLSFFSISRSARYDKPDLEVDNMINAPCVNSQSACLIHAVEAYATCGLGICGGDAVFAALASVAMHNGDPDLR